MKFVVCLVLFQLFSNSFSQNIAPQFSELKGMENQIHRQQQILIFDPNGVSASFQSSFSQLSSHSIFIADTIDEKISNYDALFLFIEYPYILSQVEGNSLIDYLTLNKPIYLSTNLFYQNIDSVDFWNHIGINDFAIFLIEVHVNFVVGIDTAFTQGVFIDTSFISGGIPQIAGQVVPILDGIDTVSINLSTTFIPADDSLNVIIDLYRMIHHTEFLEEVIKHFGLTHSVNLTVTSPNGGEHWLMGEVKNILWSSNNVDSVKIELSLYSGIPRHTIIESTPSDGLYEWLVQAPYTSWECKIHITDLADSTLSDSSDGTFVIDIFPSVDDSTNLTIPDKFGLSQNYPNPFNPSTTIKFTISDLRFTILKVYDVLGNEIANLVNEEKPAGEYEVEFDAANLPSGVYFYQLRAGRFVDTKKLILIK